MNENPLPPDADSIIRRWAAQLREDSVLVAALQAGRKVDVTLFASGGRVVRQPQITIVPDSLAGATNAR